MSTAKTNETLPRVSFEIAARMRLTTFTVDLHESNYEFSVHAKFRRSALRNPLSQNYDIPATRQTAVPGDLRVMSLKSSTIYGVVRKRTLS